MSTEGFACETSAPSLVIVGKKNIKKRGMEAKKAVQKSPNFLNETASPKRFSNVFVCAFT